MKRVHSSGGACRAAWLPLVLACAALGACDDVKELRTENTEKQDAPAAETQAKWEHPYRGTHALFEDDPMTLTDVQRKLQQGFSPATIVTDIRWRGFVGFRDREEKEALPTWLKEASIVSALNAKENTLSTAAYERYGERLSGSWVDLAAFVKRMTGQAESIFLNAGLDPALAKKVMSKGKSATIHRLAQEIEQARIDRKNAFKEGAPTEPFTERIEKAEEQLFKELTKDSDEEQRDPK